MDPLAQAFEPDAPSTLVLNGDDLFASSSVHPDLSRQAKPAATPAPLTTSTTTSTSTTSAFASTTSASTTSTPPTNKTRTDLPQPQTAIQRFAYVLQGKASPRIACVVVEGQFPWFVRNGTLESIRRGLGRVELRLESEDASTIAFSRSVEDASKFAHQAAGLFSLMAASAEENRNRSPAFLFSCVGRALVAKVASFLLRAPNPPWWMRKEPVELVWSPTDPYVVSYQFHPFTAIVLNVRTGKVAKKLVGCHSARFSMDGSLLAVQNGDRLFQLLSVR